VLLMSLNIFRTFTLVLVIEILAFVHYGTLESGDYHSKMVNT
jgi:hypothetical protein